MAKQNRTILKGYFETGDIPSQTQYADLIDSNLNLSETNTGDIQLKGNITASGEISASGLVHGSQGRFTSRVITNQINEFTLGRGITLGNNITASGNISASGRIITNDVENLNLLTLGDKDGNAGGTRIEINNSSGITTFAGNSQLKLRGNRVIINNDAEEDNARIELRGSVTASGNISSSAGTGSFGSLVVDGSSVDFSGLPTSDPGVAGRLYNDSGTIKISI